MRVSGEGGGRIYTLSACGLQKFLCAWVRVLAASRNIICLRPTGVVICLRPSACGLCLFFFFLKTGSRELLLAASRFCVVLFEGRGLRPSRLDSLGWAQVGILFELIGVQVLSNPQDYISCVHVSISLEFVGLDISLQLFDKSFPRAGELSVMVALFVQFHFHFLLFLFLNRSNLIFFSLFFGHVLPLFMVFPIMNFGVQITVAQ